MAAALAFFRENHFSYTLRPDRLGADAVDGFLFTSRKGFCEHFATGFAVLMRAAGVPTRLVGGYQGGRWNAMGDFLTVRHSDAHVWCEVWMTHRGWVRVDPTFVVAPERIDVGIEGAFDGDGLLAFLGSNPANRLTRWGRIPEPGLGSSQYTLEHVVHGVFRRGPDRPAQATGPLRGAPGRLVAVHGFAAIFYCRGGPAGTHEKPNPPPAAG